MSRVRAKASESPASPGLPPATPEPPSSGPSAIIGPPAEGQNLLHITHAHRPSSGAPGAQEPAVASMKTENKLASRRIAAVGFLVYALLAGAWIVGSNILFSNGSGAAWRTPAQALYWLLFLAGSGLGLVLLLRRAEAAVAEAARGALDGSLHYEDLFEHHPTPMWVYDSRTQRFLAVNDAALHRYGYTEAEFLQMTLRDIRPSEDVPLFLAQHTTTSSKGYGDAGIWRHRTRSGELMHMHVSLNRTTYRGTSGTLVMAREVTREVASREALEALKNSLEQRVKERTAELESANLELDAFARSAAHDLRTPLIGIMGFAQILQYELAQASPRQAESLEQIDRSAASMLELIDGLLAMSRVAQKALALEQVDLSALATTGLQRLRDAEPARRVAAQVEPGLVVEGDPTLLSSLLSNLLSNAWKYTARKDDASIEFGVQVLPDASRVYFVRDNGVGFPMEQAERLFKPFERLPSARDYQGHGVGLVTCLRVVQRHGGRIWPVSRLGAGTTIWFTLPRS